VEPKETSIASQRLGKQVSAATDTQATIEKILGTMFFRAVQSGKKGMELVNWGSIDERSSIFIRDKPILSSQRMLHKDYNRKCSVGK
jgi:hypothetical protein